MRNKELKVLLCPSKTNKQKQFTRVDKNNSKDVAFLDSLFFKR